MLALSVGGQGPQGKKRRPKHHFTWHEHVLRLTEAEFKLRYRLDFDSFMQLVTSIRPAICVSNEKQAKYAGDRIRTLVKSVHRETIYGGAT